MPRTGVEPRFNTIIGKPLQKWVESRKIDFQIPWQRSTLNLPRGGKGTKRKFIEIESKTREKKARRANAIKTVKNEGQKKREKRQTGEAAKTFSPHGT